MSSLASLFFFTVASAGFILFMTKYSHGSEVRLWGIRLCHVSGFLGVLLMRLSNGFFTELSLLISSTLIVSLVVTEVSRVTTRPEKKPRS